MPIERQSVATGVAIAALHWLIASLIVCGFALGWVLFIAIVLHALGALKRHFIDRDVTLKRMLPGWHRAESFASCTISNG